jgi:Ca2+-transporting ATPase
MQEPATLGTFLLVIAALLALTSLLSMLLEKVRIPSMVAALLVGAALRQTPLAQTLQAPPDADLFSVLAQLGVLILVFFVGLQIDMHELRQRAREVLLVTTLSTLTPFVLGTALMLALGYDALRAAVIGMTLMSTAEIVVVPILDEFGLLQTRAGQLIVSAGTLDDLIEVGLVVAVSLWIGSRTAGAAGTQLLASAAGGTLGIGTLSWASSRWLLPLLFRWMPNDAHQLVMISMFVLLGFVGLATLTGLGPLIGAIVAGLMMRPLYSHFGILGETATQTFRDMGYGFFGALFFLRVGLALDILSVLSAPWLTLAIFAAGVLGKIGGVMMLRAANKLSTLEAWTVGVGLNARLTTETIVAQMLYHAKLIPADLFGAIVAAAALSTIGVPIVFSLIMHGWGERLRSAGT